DAFATVATTRGWLSAGASQPLVALGGAGDDTFVVYSNQAPLRLEGDLGGDAFVVRAFALAQTTGDCTGVGHPSCEIVWRDAANQVAMPLLDGSQVRYAIDGPVSIDGGGGDAVTALGTEFADHV